MKHLSKATWPKLKSLFLGNCLIIVDDNKIGMDGCVSISNGNWSQIRRVAINGDLIVGLLSVLAAINCNKEKGIDLWLWEIENDYFKSMLKAI